MNKRVFEDFWFKSIWEGEKKNIGGFLSRQIVVVYNISEEKK